MIKVKNLFHQTSYLGLRLCTPLLRVVDKQEQVILLSSAKEIWSLDSSLMGRNNKSLLLWEFLVIILKQFLHKRIVRLQILSQILNLVFLLRVDILMGQLQKDLLEKSHQMMIYHYKNLVRVCHLTKTQMVSNKQTHLIQRDKQSVRKRLLS